MNSKQIYKIIKLCLKNNDSLINRADVFDEMINSGFAKRTAENHLYPSRDGGMIRKLLDAGVIEPAVGKSWSVDLAKLEEFKKPKPRKSQRVRKYSGNVPVGNDWKMVSRLDTGDAKARQRWLLFARKFGEQNYNLKVVCVGQAVEHKANYWLIANRDGLLMSKPAMLLEQHRSDIFANLTEDVARMVAE
jgi:hypothetical protein